MYREQYSADTKVKIVADIPGTDLKAGMTGVIVHPSNNGIIPFDYGMRLDSNRYIYLVNADEVQKSYTPFSGRG